MISERSTGGLVALLLRSLAALLRPDSPFPSHSARLRVVVEGPNELVARRVNEGHESGIAWDDLPARIRKPLCYKAKRWLNTRAVEQMTVARLAERDLGGELRVWLTTLATLCR